MSISANRVKELFLDCLFKSDTIEEGTEFVPVVGCTRSIGFDPARVKEHKEEIHGLLLQMDKRFFEGTGDGYSLIQAPFDKDGTQWGEQVDADRLMMLGMAIGYVDYLLPRELWSMLPGGVPYYVIHHEPREVSTQRYGEES